MGYSPADWVCLYNRPVRIGFVWRARPWIGSDGWQPQGQRPWGWSSPPARSGLALFVQQAPPFCHPCGGRGPGKPPHCTGLPRLALFCTAIFPPGSIGFVSHVCSWASTPFGGPPSGGSGAAPGAEGDIGSAGQTLGTSSLLSAIPAFGVATPMTGPSLFASLLSITARYYVV
jgi:hypothetical protein